MKETAFWHIHPPAEIDQPGRLIGLDSGFFSAYAALMDNYQSAPWDKLEKTIRHEPTKSVLLATLIGFVLSILPVGRLIGVLVKLIFVLIKPGLIVLGAVKLWEASKKRV